MLLVIGNFTSVIITAPADTTPTSYVVVLWRNARSA